MPGPFATQIRVQGIDEAQLAGEQSVKDTDWGFVNKTPDIRNLLEQKSREATSQAVQPPSGHFMDCLACILAKTQFPPGSQP